MRAVIGCAHVRSCHESNPLEKQDLASPTRSVATDEETEDQQVTFPGQHHKEIIEDLCDGSACKVLAKPGDQNLIPSSYMVGWNQLLQVVLCPLHTLAPVHAYALGDKQSLSESV